MNMPTFTAEASLYKTSGHYRIHRARHPVSSSAQMISPVSPALFQRPETVEVHSCPVGWSDFGGTCYPPLTEPPVGGGGGGDMPPGGGPDNGGPFSGESGKDDLDKVQVNGCSIRQLRSKAAKPCQDKLDKDTMNRSKHPHYVACTGDQEGNVVHPHMWCCQERDRLPPTCEKL
jgi:hypothetical protein